LKENKKVKNMTTTTVLVRQDDIQKLFQFSLEYKGSPLTLSKLRAELHSFLKKYANDYTYETGRIGAPGDTNLENFDSLYSKRICNYEKFKEELQEIQARVSKSPDSYKLTLLDDFKYIYEDVYNPFLIEFHKEGLKNANEFAEVEESDLLGLLKEAELASLPKYLPDGSLSVWFEFLATYCNQITVGYHHALGLTEEEVSIQIKNSLQLTNLVKFRKLYSKLENQYSCGCDCPKCNGFDDGYFLSDLSINKSKDFAEFELHKPDGQFYYWFGHYTNKESL